MTTTTVGDRIQQICELVHLKDQSELLTGERTSTTNQQHFDYVLICHTETGWPINKKLLFNSSRRKTQQFGGAAALLIPLSNYRERPEYFVYELPAQIKEQTSADVFNVSLALHFWSAAIKTGRSKRARVLVLIDVHSDENGETLARLLTIDVYTSQQATSSSSTSSSSSSPSNQNQLRKLKLLYQQQLKYANAVVTVRNVTPKQSEAVRKLSKNKIDEGKALLDRIWSSSAALRRCMPTSMIEEMMAQM